MRMRMWLWMQWLCEARKIESKTACRTFLANCLNILMTWLFQWRKNMLRCLVHVLVHMLRCVVILCMAKCSDAEKTLDTSGKFTMANERTIGTVERLHNTISIWIWISVEKRPKIQYIISFFYSNTRKSHIRKAAPTRKYNSALTLAYRQRTQTHIPFNRNANIVRSIQIHSV